MIWRAGGARLLLRMLRAVYTLLVAGLVTGCIHEHVRCDQRAPSMWKIDEQPPHASYRNWVQRRHDALERGRMLYEKGMRALRGRRKAEEGGGPWFQSSVHGLMYDGGGTSSSSSSTTATGCIGATT